MGLSYCRAKVSYSEIQALWATRSLFSNDLILRLIFILLILFTCVHILVLKESYMFLFCYRNLNNATTDYTEKESLGLQ